MMVSLPCSSVKPIDLKKKCSNDLFAFGKKCMFLSQVDPGSHMIWHPVIIDLCRDARFCEIFVPFDYVI